MKREVDECIRSIEDEEIAIDEDKDLIVIKNHYLECRLEYADCLMYLIDSASRFGLSLEDLFEALQEKLEINKKRDWKINDDKSYSHVK